MSLRDDLLALGSKREQTALKSFPGAFARKLSVAEVNSLSTGEKETSGFRLFALCIVDKEGAPAFGEDAVSEIASLPAESFGAIIREAMAYNGMNDDSGDAAAKN